MSRIGYYAGADARNNVLSFLEDHMVRKPGLVPLRWVNPGTLKAWLSAGKSSEPLQHESITIQAFYDQIGRLAGGLSELGITKGDRVILFVPMSVQLYTSMFALQRIGAIPVFLDSWARRAHLGASARIVAPKAMISFEKAYELCDAIPELSAIGLKICVGPASRKFTAQLSDLLATSKIAPITPVEQEETALITFTTGSSGVPKGANRTHRFLAAQHYALNAGLPYVEKDVDLPVFPIFSLNNLAAGVSTVIPAFDIGVPGDHDPLILLAQLESCKVSCTTLSPSLFNRLALHCAEKKNPLVGIRRAVTGGAPVSRDNVVDFKAIAPSADIWVLFGSTEVEPMAHIEAKEMIAMKTRASDDPEWVDEGVNVGHTAEGLEYRFLKIIKGPVEIKAATDWKSIEVPKGEVGELIVAGEHVCRNYYNDEEAFKRAKILDEKGVVWHRTGDLGRIDSSGCLWIVGRVHNAIQRDSRYVFPVRAEIIMKKLPFVKLCAYLGVSDAKLGEKTVCVLAPNDGADLEKLRAEVIRIMAKNGMPVDQVVFRDRIPMDPRHHSKVEYDVLRKELLDANLV